MMLNKGRASHLEYDSLEDTIEAAMVLEREPRERAESITFNGEPCLDPAAIEARIRSLP